LTQGGIGVREAALVRWLPPFGATSHLVLARDWYGRASSFAGGLISGCIAMLLGRATPGDLSQGRSAPEPTRGYFLTIFVNCATMNAPLPCGLSFV